MKQIENILKMNIDAEYAAFHKKICPGIQAMLGVRMPVLQLIARQIADQDWRKFLEQETFYYEETMLQGLILGYVHCPIEEHLQYLEKFIPKISNWAVCDSVCSRLKFVRNNREKVWQFLQPYLISKKEFEVRFAVVMLLDHFLKTEDWYFQVINQLNYIKHEGYYVKMAAAWTLAEAFLYNPNFMKAYLQKIEIDLEIKHRMFQKIMDSKRLKPEDRKWVKENRK